MSTFGGGEYDAIIRGTLDLTAAKAAYEAFLAEIQGKPVQVMPQFGARGAGGNAANFAGNGPPPPAQPGGNVNGPNFAPGSFAGAMSPQQVSAILSGMGATGSVVSKFNAGGYAGGSEMFRDLTAKATVTMNAQGEATGVRMTTVDQAAAAARQLKADQSAAFRGYIAERNMQDAADFAGFKEQRDDRWRTTARAKKAAHMEAEEADDARAEYNNNLNQSMRPVAPPRKSPRSVINALGGFFAIHMALREAHELNELAQTGRDDSFAQAMAMSPTEGYQSHEQLIQRTTSGTFGSIGGLIMEGHGYLARKMNTTDYAPSSQIQRDRMGVAREESAQREFKNYLQDEGNRFSRRAYGAGGYSGIQAHSMMGIQVKHDAEQAMVFKQIDDLDRAQTKARQITDPTDEQKQAMAMRDRDMAELRRHADEIPKQRDFELSVARQKEAERVSDTVAISATTLPGLRARAAGKTGLADELDFQGEQERRRIAVSRDAPQIRAAQALQGQAEVNAHAADITESIRQRDAFTGAKEKALGSDPRGAISAKYTELIRQAQNKKPSGADLASRMRELTTSEAGEYQQLDDRQRQIGFSESSQLEYLKAVAVRGGDYHNQIMQADAMRTVRETQAQAQRAYEEGRNDDPSRLYKVGRAQLQAQKRQILSEFQGAEISDINKVAFKDPGDSLKGISEALEALKNVPTKNELQKIIDDAIQKLDQTN